MRTCQTLTSIIKIKARPYIMQAIKTLIIVTVLTITLWPLGMHGAGEGQDSREAEATPAFTHNQIELANKQLLTASLNGNTYGVNQALSKGANVNQVNLGWTPLDCAIFKNYTEIASILLANGANASRAKTGDEPPLYWAINHDNVEIVKKLLEKGANPNHVDVKGNTPLMQAILNKGSHEMIQILINADSYVNNPSNFKTSPLSIETIKEQPSSLLNTNQVNTINTYIAEKMVLMLCTERIYSAIIKPFGLLQICAGAAYENQPVIHEPYPLTPLLLLSSAAAASAYGIYHHPEIPQNIYQTIKREIIQAIGNITGLNHQVTSNNTVDALEVAMPQLLLPILRDKNIINIIKNYAGDSDYTDEQRDRADMWQDIAQQSYHNEAMAQKEKCMHLLPIENKNAREQELRHMREVRSKKFDSKK